MKKLLAGFTAAVLAVTAVFSGGLAAQAAGYHEYDVEKYVMEELSAASIPGVSISIVSDQKEIYSATFGVDGKTASDYVLGNLTQSITALAVLSLAEDGEIRLEDDITEYLPENALQGVTIEQLLHQTSGITKETTRDHLEVKGPAGVYQNAYVNYTILGELIEKVSQETYEEYITENILDACKMESTYSLRQNPELEGEMSSSYRNYFGYPSLKKYKYDAKDNWVGISSGHMISDVKDIGNYLQMYLKDGGEAIRPENIAGVLQNTVPVTDESREDSLYGTTESYGMGWMSTEYKGEEIYYQSGVLEDQMTMMFLIPDRNVGVVMLFNGGDYLVGKKLMEKVCVGVTDIILGDKPARIDKKTYLVQHGVIDLILLVMLLGACMPIFLSGIWRKRASREFNVIRLAKDLALQIVLPTLILLLVTKQVFPWSLLLRTVPDIAMVLIAVIVLLYLGGALKLVRGLLLFISYKMDSEKYMEALEAEEEEKEQDDAAGELIELQPAEQKAEVQTEEQKAAVQSDEQKPVTKPEQKIETEPAEQTQQQRDTDAEAAVTQTTEQPAQAADAQPMVSPEQTQQPVSANKQQTVSTVQQAAQAIQAITTQQIKAQQEQRQQTAEQQTTEQQTTEQPPH